MGPAVEGRAFLPGRKPSMTGGESLAQPVGGNANCVWGSLLKTMVAYCVRTG